MSTHRNILLMLQKSQTTTFWMFWNPVKNGIDMDKLYSNLNWWLHDIWTINCSYIPFIPYIPSISSLIMVYPKDHWTLEWKGEGTRIGGPGFPDPLGDWFLYTCFLSFDVLSLNRLFFFKGKQTSRPFLSGYNSIHQGILFIFFLGGMIGDWKKNHHTFSGRRLLPEWWLHQFFKTSPDSPIFYGFLSLKDSFFLVGVSKNKTTPGWGMAGLTRKYIPSKINESNLKMMVWKMIFLFQWWKLSGSSR